MANVMLINPSSKAILNNAGDRPPLGLLYIAAELRNKGHTVRVRDMDHTSHVQLITEVNDNPPDFAGVSCYTSPLYNESVELGNYLSDKCHTIVGGYHATAMPQTLTKHFDTVIVGEGEMIFPKIIESKRKGIVVGSKMFIGQVPHPARDLVDMQLYNFRQDGRPASTLLASRGCPNQCVFCGNMNQQVRLHSIDYVVKEIETLKNYGFNDLYFYDDAFVVGKERTMKLLDAIGKQDIHYRITTRAKSLDEDVVKKLAETGCSWVSIGIESGSPERLKDVSKNMTLLDNWKAISKLTRYDIKSKGFFMFGLPNESASDAQKTVDFALELKRVGLTSADFYIMTPFPGTKIWNEPEKHGITIHDRDFTKYLEAGKEPSKAFHSTTNMTSKEIETWRLHAEERWKEN